MSQSDTSGSPRPDAEAPTVAPRPPGVCVPWDQKKRQLPPITGDEALVRKTWEDFDGLAHMYIWHLLVSF
jgi:hypothetical protein